MTDLKFTALCPHCDHENTTRLSTDQPKDDLLMQCSKCDLLFVVKWALKVDASIFRVDPGYFAPARVIVEVWPDDEEDDDYEDDDDENEIPVEIDISERPKA